MDQPARKFDEITVLWITAALGCDGDTISLTASTQPNTEDLILGAIPGVPKLSFVNPFLAYEVGDEHKSAAGN